MIGLREEQKDIFHIANFFSSMNISYYIFIIHNKTKSCIYDGLEQKKAPYKQMCEKMQ